MSRQDGGIAMKENQYQYIKIKDYIQKNIQKGVYKDDRIESENCLAKQFHVSRMTVRQALLSLQQEGLIYTVPKKGAYVQKQKSLKTLDGLQSFSEDVSRLEGDISSQIILCQKEKTDDMKLQSLGLLDKNQEVWHIVRVRYMDREPIAYEDGYYHGGLVPDISVQVLQQSLYAYFENELQLNIAYSHQQIDACLAEQFAHYLEISKEQPLLRILQTTYLKDDVCLEYGYTYYRVDKYSFNQIAYRKKGGL